MRKYEDAWDEQNVSDARGVGAVLAALFIGALISLVAWLLI